MSRGKNRQNGCAASVLVTTYNWPTALSRVLVALANQTDLSFEVVIADDGSRSDTAEMIAGFAKSAPIEVVHIWQPDDGFNKCRALNKAIAISKGRTIIVTDGDCVVRSDFVATHLSLTEPGRFLSGSYYKLPARVSDLITSDLIESQEVFSAKWLLRNGVKLDASLLKVLAKGKFSRFLDRTSTARPSWNGHSASCLREHAIAVNGFNEDMGYGGLDVEFGLRLNNYGLTAKKIRYSTLALHLHHARPYDTPHMRKASQEVKERTRANSSKWADKGLDQWLRPSGSVELPAEDYVIRYPAVGR
ncbi:MAG: glycosyltransferase family 2 protein [Allorhizobium sp.]